jgi:hypothetical protein
VISTGTNTNRLTWTQPTWYTPGSLTGASGGWIYEQEYPKTTALTWERLLQEAVDAAVSAAMKEVTGTLKEVTGTLKDLQEQIDELWEVLHEEDER